MSTRIDPIDYDYISAENIRLRSDNVLIKFVEAPTETASGIALPRAGYARPIDGREAIVVATGPGPSYRKNCDKCGRPHDPYLQQVKPGDHVITDGRNPGERIWLNGTEHRVVREAELLAVVER